MAAGRTGRDRADRRKVGTSGPARYTKGSGVARSADRRPTPGNERLVVTIHSNRALRRDLETIFQAGTLAGLTDGQLLERFMSRRGLGGGVEAEAAFAMLIERHGPMVLRVCRGVLGDPHEAEDAFQATFLVLLRQAGAIRKRESVGPWLHGVAHRVASCARSAAARRRAHERRWSEPPTRRDSGIRPSRPRPPGDDPRRAGAPARALSARRSCSATWRSTRSTRRRGSSAGRWGRSRAGSTAAGSSSATAWCAAASRRGSPGWRSPGRPGPVRSMPRSRSPPRWPRRRRR